MRALLAAITFLAMFSGCASRRISMYRYVATADTRILIPPGAKDARVTTRTLQFPAGTTADLTCAASDEGIRVALRARSIRVTAQREQLLKLPPGGLAVWAASYEKRGCVATGAGLQLATRIAETLPLDPKVFDSLLHPGPLQGGYVDLAAGSRLKVVSPILRDPAQRDNFVVESPTGSGDRSLAVVVKPTSNFLGYETVWYKMEPRPGGSGERFTFMSGESRTGDQVNTEARPRIDYLVFAPDAAYFRLFFLTRISKADHDIAILGAPTPAALDEMTSRLQENPQDCSGCVMIPQDVAVVPHFAVTVNGKEVAVPIGASVATAISASGEQNPDRAIATLQLRRPYANTLAPVTFDRTKHDILRLPLRGGEDLRF